MAEERSGLYLISIVAVVAVVGLVTIFLRGGEAPSASVAGGELVPALDEEGNVVGEAIYLRSLVKPRRVMPRVALSQVPPSTAEEMCSDTDSYVTPEGDRRYYKGSVRYWNPTSKVDPSLGGTWVSSSDRCSGDTVVEQYCFEGGKAEKSLSCPGRCDNGACVLI